MLNELLRMERGATASGVKLTPRHSDIKGVRKVPSLLVHLDKTGLVDVLYPVADTVSLWSLRDGQHNSFPFVQPKKPLWEVFGLDSADIAIARNRKNPERRSALLRLAAAAPLHSDPFGSWLTKGLLDRLVERRQQLATLASNDGSNVLAAIDGFLVACDTRLGGNPSVLQQRIVATLLERLRDTAADDWINVAVSLLIVGDGAFFFGSQIVGALPIIDPRIIDRVSEAMRVRRAEGLEVPGVCALSGQVVPLVADKFPQPNLPLLGQTFLFARNVAVKANNRYQRTAVESMPVGRDVSERLSAALSELTSPERKGKTWRTIPGEKPEESDLLIAFVEGVPGAEPVGLLTESDDEDEEEVTVEGRSAISAANYERRISRLVDAVKGRRGDDFRKTPVQLVVLRRVDPANRKVVSYGRGLTVDSLYTAATDWTEGTQNLPEWLAIGIFIPQSRKIVRKRPPHVAPLELIRFSRRLFLAHGTRRVEARGIPAAEALEVFLSSTSGRRADPRSVSRLFHLVLQRRSMLLAGVAHSLHRNDDSLFDFDRGEALRTCTVIAILLHKLQRSRNDYMNDAGFKLGQLLAITDALHVGYCAEMRQGSIPPSLLGNQVLATAQSAPEKALAILARRWKPYAGWARRAASSPKRGEEVMKMGRDEQAEWNIRKALRQYRELPKLAAELHETLKGVMTDDAFRAELLLGYMAGLPAAEKKDIIVNGNASTQTMEIEL